MSILPLYQVDSFADRPFAGNPAGVCLLDAPRPDEWMRSLAMEMNLSETAFLLPEGDAYRLRWFTPAAEVELCGHATLASAHILWESGRLRPDEMCQFETLSGLLTARRDGEWIELNFPATPVMPAETSSALDEALGAKSVFTGRSIFDIFVELGSEAEVRALKPDLGRVKQFAARGVIVTARGSGEYDFVSRFFGPQVGVDEDPVTGSAHSALAPYWAEKLGKTAFLAYQASRRGGVLRVKLAGDRVLIGGQAVTFFKTQIEG